MTFWNSMVSRIDTQQTLNSDLFVILSIYMFWFSVFFCGGLLVVHLDKTMVQVESETLRHERKMYIKETLQVRVSRSTGIHVRVASCVSWFYLSFSSFFYSFRKLSKATSNRNLPKRLLLTRLCWTFQQ